jgi:hypothetical protein
MTHHHQVRKGSISAIPKQTSPAMQRFVRFTITNGRQAVPESVAPWSSWLLGSRQFADKPGRDPVGTSYGGVEGGPDFSLSPDGQPGRTKLPSVSFCNSNMCTLFMI